MYDKAAVKRVALLVFAIIIVLSIIALSLITPVWEWLTYWLYYKPFYTIFPDSLYLPFYLHVAAFVILGLLFILIVYWGHIKDCRLRTKQWGDKIVLCIIAAVVVVFWAFLAKDVYKDVQVMRNEKYRITECKLDSLSKRRSRSGGGRRGGIYYRLKGKVNGKDINVKMDIYQYRQLFRLREQTTGQAVTLKVYYLPETKRMLKYEQ